MLGAAARPGLAGNGGRSSPETGGGLVVNDGVGKDDGNGGGEKGGCVGPAPAERVAVGVGRVGTVVGVGRGGREVRVSVGLGFGFGVVVGSGFGVNVGFGDEVWVGLGDGEGR